MLWATLDRHPLLVPEVEASVFDVFARKCEQLSARLLCVGGALDHVHLLLQVHPDHGVSHIAKELKGASSHFVNQRLRPGFDFRWQSSYTALSVGESELDRVYKYVRDQKLHHQKGGLIVAMEPPPG
jgi:REP element-mobilizing transposase RayT